MEPKGRRTYRGSGFPVRGSSVHDFIMIAADFEFPMIASSSSVESSGPEALQTYDSSSTPAMWVLVVTGDCVKNDGLCLVPDITLFLKF